MVGNFDKFTGKVIGGIKSFDEFVICQIYAM